MKKIESRIKEALIAEARNKYDPFTVQYLGFKVLYRNWWVKWFMRWFLPKKVVVVQVSQRTGKGQRLLVPIAQGIKTQHRVVLFQDELCNKFFVIGRIWRKR